jgi:GNAT superfamily N-acetyltransferase
MAKLDVMHLGPDRIRTGPWRGDPAVAQLVPAPGSRPSTVAINRCVARLAREGYRSVLTSALTWQEQQPFLAASFTVHERLHLLRRDLTSLPPPAPAPARLRRGRRRDLPAVLAVDAAAFDPFWRFDADGLADARRATPSTRFRVAEAERIVGYAVTGRAGTVAYLQRLAVDPGHQRTGLGRALVVDALRWAARHGATTALVNTQEHNRPALALYEQLGFVREEHGLVVLARALEHRGDPA